MRKPRQGLDKTDGAILRYFQIGFSLRDIGTKVKLSHSQVRRRLNRLQEIEESGTSLPVFRRPGPQTLGQRHVNRRRREPEDSLYAGVA
jgi:hypothetical protein